MLVRTCYTLGNKHIDAGRLTRQAAIDPHCDDLAHDLVHVVDHGRVVLPARVVDEGEVVKVRLGHLQGRVDNVERVEEEAGFRRVVLLTGDHSVRWWVVGGGWRRVRGGA